jgi:hypothetical protein
MTNMCGNGHCAHHQADPDVDCCYCTPIDMPPADPDTIMPFTTDDAIQDVLHAYGHLHNGDMGNYLEKLAHLYVALDGLRDRYTEDNDYPAAT